MHKKTLISCWAAVALSAAPLGSAQPKMFRVGVVHDGGPYKEAVEGLKDGLRDAGLEEGRQYILETRDLNGDRKAAPEVARGLERDKVDLIYTLATSVTIGVKRATATVPIVFAVGEDPVIAGLVDSYAKPGGRLTGVHFLSGDLTAKRLEILKTVLPDLRKVVTFYDPANSSALQSVSLVREAARQLRVEVVERHVASVEELRLGLQALKGQEADAFFYTNDAMVTSQSQFIIDTAMSKKMPTMFPAPSSAAQGALVAYGVSYYQIGRLSAKYVQRVATGTHPRDLPVESFSQLSLVVNLKTAKALDITVPQSVLMRADEVIR